MFSNMRAINSEICSKYTKSAQNIENYGKLCKKFTKTIRKTEKLQYRHKKNVKTPINVQKHT